MHTSMNGRRSSEKYTDSDPSHNIASVKIFCMCMYECVNAECTCSSEKYTDSENHASEQYACFTCVCMYIK
jgi:hypothetical protein